jgi:hypothetical protein
MPQILHATLCFIAAAASYAIYTTARIDYISFLEVYPHLGRVLPANAIMRFRDSLTKWLTRRRRNYASTHLIYSTARQRASFIVPCLHCNTIMKTIIENTLMNGLTAHATHVAMISVSNTVSPYSFTI